MADYRTIHSKMWHDSWFSDLETDAKILFVYLITNPTASVSGIYTLPIKFIAFETGIDPLRVEGILIEFATSDKIEWEGDVIWVKKMREYQATSSPKVATRILRDVSEIPDCDIKRHYCEKYGIDTLSLPIPELDTDTDTETETETEPKDISGAVAPKLPASPPDSGAIPEQKPSTERFTASTEAGRLFFAQFKRKRWGTTEERDQFEKCEAEVGIEIMCKAVRWAAGNRIAKVPSICSCARKMAGKMNHAPTNSRANIEYSQADIAAAAEVTRRNRERAAAAARAAVPAL